MPPKDGILARVLRYKRLYLWAVAVFVLDQVTKAWVAETLPFNTYYPPDRITVIPDFFFLVHVGNTGAAWGLFAGKSVWLALLAAATLTAIFLFRKHLELRQRVVQITFGLLCGGILGNLIDRLIHGHVVDFLLFTFGSFHWPAFNIADSGICIAVCLYLIQSFREPGKPAAPAPE